MHVKTGAPSRNVTEIQRGDYVKIGQTWKKVEYNSAAGASGTPRHWEVKTEDGGTYSMFQINRYAKAEDIGGK